MCHNPPGMCEITSKTTGLDRGVRTLETAMLALQRQVLCLSEPWLANLNSELQFRSSLQVANVLSEALVAVGYAWAKAKQRVFGAAKRRRRALNVSYHLEDQLGAAYLEVWGLAVNILEGPRTPVPGEYASSRGTERSDFPNGMPSLTYWGYYTKRSWDSWYREDECLLYRSQYGI